MGTVGSAGTDHCAPGLPITESTVRQVAATTPSAGTTKNIPSTPAIAAPAGIATSTIAGWMWTVLP